MKKVNLVLILGTLLVYCGKTRITPPGNHLEIICPDKELADVFSRAKQKARSFLQTGRPGYNLHPIITGQYIDGK